jgi:hypothetical protein
MPLTPVSTLLRLTSACLLLLMGACQAAAPQARKAMDPALQAQVDSALNNATQRSGLPRARLVLIDAEYVTWPDGAAGCPEPGVMYTQALVSGVRVRIKAGTEVLNYHGARHGAVAFCPAGRVGQPAAGGDPRI